MQLLFEKADSQLFQAAMVLIFFQGIKTKLKALRFKRTFLFRYLSCQSPAEQVFVVHKFLDCATRNLPCIYTA